MIWQWQFSIWLQHVIVCCWIWQCATASVGLNNEWLLTNDEENSRCQYGFNNIDLVLRGRSASCQVAAFGPCACHNIASGRSGKTQAVIANWEPYLTVILRHCVRRDPNNQIRLRSPIYSSAMLIKLLRYRHESSSYACAKRSPFVYISWSDSYALRWCTKQKADPKLQRTLKGQNRCSKVALIINMHVFMYWMPDCKNWKSLHPYFLHDTWVTLETMWVWNHLR